VTNSRKLEDLHPIVQAKAKRFIDACRLAGIDVLITSTYRSKESQDDLFAQGRTRSGKKVTNARGGMSFHNYRVAFDFVPLENGKPIWDDIPMITSIGEIGEGCGLEWAGRWVTFREYLHFQFTGGLTIKDFQNGKTLEAAA
jgi:peptidoglycan L-alanyl-D-glutamate endopeptidase CwlK